MLLICMQTFTSYPGTITMSLKGWNYKPQKPPVCYIHGVVLEVCISLQNTPLKPVSH